MFFLHRAYIQVHVLAVHFDIHAYAINCFLRMLYWQDTFQIYNTHHLWR